MTSSTGTVSKLVMLRLTQNRAGLIVQFDHGGSSQQFPAGLTVAETAERFRKLADALERGDGLDEAVIEAIRNKPLAHKKLIQELDSQVVRITEMFPKPAKTSKKKGK